MRPIGRFAGALALVFAGGCFEPPVVEVLLFHFRDDGGASATLEVQLADPDDVSSPGGKRRVRETERTLLDGSDPWLDRFAAIAAASDSLAWRRTAGELRSFSRTVEVADPAALAPLLGADGAHWSYEREGREAELEIVPARGGRASRRDRDRVLHEIGNWSALYADYVAAARAVDALAVARPAIAAELWAAALRDGAEEAEALAPDEVEAAARLQSSMQELLAAFAADDREGSSIAERVRAAFHPFAAQIGFELPCRADEAEGFVEADPGDYVVPELALGDAAKALDGRWLAVDPLAAILERLSLDDPTPEVAAFVERPLTTEAPAPDGPEVADAILDALAAPERYRLAWSCLAVPAEGEPAP